MSYLNVFFRLFYRYKSRVHKPKKPNVQLPYSRPGESKNPRVEPAQKLENKKTSMGRQFDLPYREQAARKPGSDIVSCPQCQYPLRGEPSASSPCPNCGFSGAIKQPGITAINHGKTMPVSGLEAEPEAVIREFKFKLIEEANNSEIKIQSDDAELILNRSHLDPSNTSISAEQHILIRYRDNRIFMEDVSSNGSTFIQVKKDLILRPGTRLVMGNKIFIFNLPGASVNDTKADRATRKFGDFDLNSQGANGFELADEKSGKRLVFREPNVIVNRTNLDPGNNTISGSQHAGFSFENGNWLVKDMSSTGATFMQVKTECPLENKVKIIIGNKVYRFEYDV